MIDPRLTRRGLLVAAAAFGVAADSPPSASPPSASGPPAEPDLYRTSDYNAPTPATLNGAAALTTAAAARLWKDKGAIFVDAQARPPRPAGLPAGTLWRPKPRDDIPGGIWLVDTGYGRLPPLMARYFADGLRQATGGDRDRTLVFYCRTHCWMSWNAARRAEALGYTRVRWYRDGTDGWAAAGLPLRRAEPVARPPAG